MGAVLRSSTDLAILRQLARRLKHPAAGLLDKPYVHYVGNQPRKAQEHFYGLREAKPDLVGAALYDRLELPLPTDPNLVQATWRQRELENYVCQRNVLLSYASWEGQRHVGELFANAWEQTMEETIGEIEDALRTLGEPSPWGPEIKASDAFLDRVFKRFYEKLKLPNLMSKTDYHELANHLDEKAIDPEIGEKLDLLMQTEERARPRKS